ncbi:ATP-binding protein, partial [uncultured Sharpea sp.]
MATLRFIEGNENILFVGSPGTGKTHLAAAIGT